MPDRSRIPRKIKGFASYIQLTANYLQTGEPNHAERLGILPSELATWIKNAQNWEPLYLLYIDKKNSRTTAVKDQLNQLITELVDLDRTHRLLDRISASPHVTQSDFNTFNIKRGRLQKIKHTVLRTPITEQVLASIKPLGGGSVSIKCSAMNRNTAAIIAGADSVQMAWAVGNNVPESPDDALCSRDISTKASFTLKLRAESAKNVLYIYFRWYNTRRPNLSGPWSSRYNQILL